MLKAMFLFVFVLILLDIYVFKGIYPMIDAGNRALRSGFLFGYWTLSIIVLIALVVMFMYFTTIREEHPIFWVIGASAFFVIFVPKMIFASFHLLDDVFNLLSWGVSKLGSGETDWSRRDFISKMGLGVSGVVMLGFIYGVTKGKFAFRVISHKVPSSRLPMAFDGFRIVQISDAHLGSFIRDYEPINRMVDMVNDLEPDLILFTGDMVNEHAQEAEGWEPVFSRLKAKHGKFSIFGNHDYAHYGPWNEEEQADSIARLKQVHARMGFRLMEDEAEQIIIDGESIDVLGVHNWGKGFGEYGDLDKAMNGLSEERFKVLLSHDPTHFEYKVLGKAPVDLTLSGHTHGMQMGLEIPALGIKWSPVSFRYKRWAGLYQEGTQFLHVNRGMGVLGFPGRVGMAPEITLLELKKA